MQASIAPHTDASMIVCAALHSFLYNMQCIKVMSHTFSHLIWIILFYIALLKWPAILLPKVLQLQNQPGSIIEAAWVILY